MTTTTNGKRDNNSPESGKNYFLGLLERAGDDLCNGAGGGTRMWRAV
jgi:hypothetical protein